MAPKSFAGGDLLQSIKMLQRNFDKGPIEIWPLADLHIGSREFDTKRFLAWREKVLSKSNRQVVILGDIIDNGIKSSIASPYESTMTPKEQREYAAELLRPLRGRIICILSGNHEYRSRKDTDTDPAELIAAKLGLEDVYRADVAILHIRVGKVANGHSKSPSYSIGLTHGSSNGMTLGAGINRMGPLAIAMGVDMMIMGHTHKPVAAPTMRYEVNKHRGTVTAVPVMLLVATSWMQYGGYGARKMMLPTPIASNHAVLEDKEFGITLVQQ